MVKFKTLSVSLLIILMMIAGGCGGSGYSSGNEETVPAKTGTNTSPKPEETSDDPAMAELKSLQEQVDQGRQSWRLDPVAVAKESVTGDSFKIVSNDGVSKAVISVKQGSKTLTVILYKPVKQDKTGIWALESLK